MTGKGKRNIIKKVSRKVKQMELSFEFYFNSILLGAGLAMDAFSVSLANGLSEPSMKIRKMSGISGVFAFFQALMPMLGWICVHTFLQCFGIFEKFIPYIAFGLLLFIGGKMIIEGIKNKDGEDEEHKGVTFGALLIQGVATSIDALSVGFTIADYDLKGALIAAGIIAAVTFVLCFLGIILGKNLGTRLQGKANILGGAILVFIGAEILIKSFFT